MTHLTKKQFRDAVQKGLGRTIMHVCEQGQKGLENVILDACLHNLTYDPQCEESRVDWLIKLLDLTGEAPFYHQRILEALPNATDYWEAHQLVELAAELAKRGSAQAYEAIYHKFELQQFNESWLGGYQIIDIDGIEGLIRVAEIIGARLLKDSQCWEDDCLVLEAEKHFDYETIMSALEKQSPLSANVRAYKDAVVGYRKSVQTAQRRHRLHLDLNQILFKIETTDGANSYLCSNYGYCASDEEIEQIFVRLLTETRREQLLRYLWIFRRRALPRLDEHLLNLAVSNDNQIQEAAITAIAHTKDESVRTLARKLLQEQPRSIYQGAIKLFINNYTQEDRLLIESVLCATESPNMLHALGCDILALAETQDSPELAGCCLWVYEHTPCSSCRKSAVATLIERKQATDALSECFWDCSKEIRTLAKTHMRTQKICFDCSTFPTQRLDRL